MAINWSSALSAAKSIAGHPITKGGALASLISGGLYIAATVGVPIPGVALLLGPAAGYVLYYLLPKKAQTEIDAVAQEVTDAVSKIPSTYPEYPGKDGQPSTSQGAPNTNIDQKQG
jgi:hypothetical protein